MRPKGDALNHPASEDLLQYATQGCPVDCGRDWTIEELEAAIKKGLSVSMDNPEAAISFREEALQKVQEGHYRLVSWNNSIKDNPPAKLKISQIAAIPHKSRKFRMILNLSSKLRVGGQKLKSVNESSNKDIAPQHAMYEMGNVIPRFIWTMTNAPNNTPFLFTKIDLKDGYWRMVVNPDKAWNFAYVLPRLSEDEEI